MKRQAVLLPNLKHINPDRYLDAIELIHQAAFDLDRFDPSDTIASEIVISAYLARAALDDLAYNATLPRFPRSPYSWDDLGDALGLTPSKAKKLISKHLDQFPHTNTKNIKKHHTNKKHHNIKTTKNQPIKP